MYYGKREELEEIDLTWEELGTSKELRKVQYDRTVVDKEDRDGNKFRQAVEVQTKENSKSQSKRVLLEWCEKTLERVNLCLLTDFFLVILYAI